ncbi:MAG TPA: TRAP transporter substrate-binding protein DctP [Deltaproteobacteria bacterium]|nr:TRAP transporter substrate-binding protein DctP [Deltaproteobacteria bacterium]
MGRKCTVSLLVFVMVIGLSFNVMAAKPKPIVWKMQASYPLGTTVMMHGEEWQKYIEQITDGRLKVEILPPGAMCAVGDIVTYLEQGVFDCAVSYGGFYTGLIPETDLEIGLPMGHQTWDEYWDAYWNRGLGEVIREAYAEHNIIHYPCAAGCYYHFNTNFPVTKLEDLKGKKIRALGIYGKYVQALGGSAVVIPGGELYMAMKLGTIDGAIYDASGLMDVKFHEVVEYYTFPTAAQIALSFLINKDSFDKLPDDLKPLVNLGTRFILEDSGNRYITETKESFNAARNMGSVQACWLPEEELVKARKLVAPLWDELGKKSPRMEKGVTILKKQMKDVGRPMD